MRQRLKCEAQRGKGPKLYLEVFPVSGFFCKPGRSGFSEVKDVVSSDVPVCML